jgi:hypothetical protein
MTSKKGELVGFFDPKTTSVDSIVKHMVAHMDKCDAEDAAKKKTKKKAAKK